MSADGSPEFSAKRFGEEIARLRTIRAWSRAKLINHLHDQVDELDIHSDSLSETWLARLEAGRVVKVPRILVEALCRALQCTPHERSRVLLFADRSVLVNAENTPDKVAELLAYSMERVYTEMHEILSNSIGNRQISQLDDEELFELIATALDLTAKRHRRR